MREFDGFSGVAAMAGQGWEWDGVSAQSDEVVGANHALVAQAEATGQIEVARQGAKVASGVGGRAGRAARAILARPALLRRRQFGGTQDAAHGLAADGEVLFAAKFFRQMGIVKALILAAGQAQDQLLLGNRNRPRHGASAIAVLYPGYGVGAVPPLQPLHLALTQLQQAGGFAYAQPPARCILNHFHPLELFLTHGHHPSRVTESRCSYGVTLSW